MKNFFRTVLANTLGCLFSSIILILLFVFIIGGIISSSSKDKKIDIKTNSILHLDFDFQMAERASKNPINDIDFISMKSSQTIGLLDMINSIKNAATDDKISGMFIEPSSLLPDLSTLEEIRNALIYFKEQGKFIIAYADDYSQKAYYISSIADKIYLTPEGEVDFRGLASQLYFLKGTFSKLDIETQILRHGKFKSAIEPYVLDKMSDENREQYTVLLNSIWSKFKEDISVSRGIPVETLDMYAEKYMVRKASDALKYELIDSLLYKDEVLEILKNKTNSKKDINKLETVSMYKYVKHYQSTYKEKNDSKIAIVYATGEIGMGKGSETSIGSDDLSKVLRDARLDNKIKAVVLRINSPGGSALASDIILREVILLNQAKPVVISMGNLAASGGYYIACGASKIVAQHTTLTGSIGVFGLMFNLDKFFKNKLGVTFDVVKTNEYADMPSMIRALTPSERNFIQENIEDIYDTFITHVANGRKMEKSEVDKIGQGRVWTGYDAKNINLVDEIGGLDKAIAISAELADLKDYSIVELPKQKDFYDEIISSLMNTYASKSFEQKIKKQYPFLKHIEEIESNEVFMTRLPFDIVIE